MYGSNSFPRRHPRAALCLALVVGSLAGLVQAASTDIASEPVITRADVSAKPNMMFILDDSGSMAWSYMPDELGDNNNDPRTGKYGYWSPQCNGLAFDSSYTYDPPVKADGTEYAAATYTAAKNDGFLTGSSTKDLTGSYFYRYATTGTLQTKLSWTFDSSGNVITSSTFYQECMSDTGSAPGSGKFTKVDLSSLTAADRQNYANWYSYYSKRYLLMRTAVGRAVQALDTGYRLGFSRINSTSITDGADFRDAKPFDSTQKNNFYSSLYGASPGGGTPLRGALSKIGRYYAKKLPSQTYDPVEYSCQRNYALLSTDGYWNLGGSPGPAESSSYGPLDLSGNNVGNQDSSEIRPMYDGGSSTTTYTTPTTTVTLKKTDSQVKATTVSTRNRVVVANCGTFRYRTSTTPQTRTTTTTTTSTVYSQDTLTSTRVVVVTNGTQTSDTTTSGTTTTTPSSPAATSTVTGTTDTGWVNGTTVNGGCVLSFGPASDTTTTAVSTNSSANVVAPTTSTVSVTGPTTGATTQATTTTGGSSDTLSDVAEYYYVTDLRTAALGNCASKNAANVTTDVCSNDVPSTLADPLKSQRMNTFTIGLGVSGTLTYDPNYLKQTTTGDYAALKNGTKSWPATTTTINGGSGDARNIDDLWHAAVNGRGQYYSALNADALGQAISGVVTVIKAQNGSGAAASFNTLAFVSGTSNRVYQAGYSTQTWVGEVLAYATSGATGDPVDSNTADNDPLTPVWSAQKSLDAKAWATRNIYYRKSTSDATLRAFNVTNLTADGYLASFNNFCTKATVPSQCVDMSASATNTPTNLINFLRGERTYELGAPPMFRPRTNVLGDIINGAPVYVGKPPFGYTDAGYSSFASTRASRQAAVFAGANDGMLHAFDATTGNEMWAYIPTTVMPNMYRLADASYASSHAYFVDAEPVVGDIYVGGAWKTILVGGLGGGGKAYYALDVTDPANPISLWEFTNTTDANLGLTFGNPVITKRADGTWVVVFASGYNNTTGDGKGRLYVLNANTGAKLLDIPTSAGTAANPAGLAKINAWVDASTNNSAKRFYGGDLLGNFWRFDIDNLVQPNQSAHLMAQFGATQPITTKPEPALVSGTYPVVVVGTGRYLGISDVTDTSVQSLYVLKDSLTATGLGSVRSNGTVVKHTVSVVGKSSSTTTEPVVWQTNNGWYVDFPQSGERMVTNLAVLSGNLTVGTAIPNSDACTAGGASWLYRINLTTGGASDKDVPFGQQFSDKAVIVGLTGATLSDGSSVIYVKDSSGKTEKRPTGTAVPPGTGDPRRTSWRELLN